ncbi:UNVERIFIED_CONTAM: hypothetical protein Scaly_2251100 [Sesamum calycinum]|uniref:DDE Tnp4 domain-containing protein n=1 Tax=Sesamum calycinum TaxID=2727403 RepID=A0AAW2M9Q7_9LAMI
MDHEMERVFIELMHEEFISHRLQSSTFPPWVWSRWGWDSERNTITDDAGRLEELYQQNPEYKKIVEHGLPRFELCTQMFSRNTVVGGLARSSSQPRRSIHSTHDIDEEQMEGTQSGSRRSRDEYEDTSFSQSPPMMSPNEYTSSPQPSQTCAGPSGSGRWTYFHNMASSREEGGPEVNSTSESPRIDIERVAAAWSDVSGLHRSFGRHVGRHGSPVDQNRYRSRKGSLAQNVLAICDFDMNFTYVYAGWEGSAPMLGSWTMRYHMRHFSLSPIGKYYLVDAGFTNYQCFLGPYRGTRYHLPEWRGQGRPYGTPQDMFNHAHSRLRNVIERCFGLLKKRFPILQWGMPSYLLNHQVDI